MPLSKESQSHLFAITAVILWSTVAIVFKLALRNIEIIDILFGAILTSWITLGITVLFRIQNMRMRTQRKNILQAVLLGFVNPLMYYTVLFIAYNRLPAQIAQPLNYTWPIFLVIFAIPINDLHLKIMELLGILVSLIGVTLISHTAHIDGSFDPWGVVLALGSGAIWAIYWVVGSRLKMDGVYRLFIGFSAALPIFFTLWWIEGMRMPQNGVAWVAVLWIGLFEMGIAFICWNVALQNTRHPARISNLVYLSPLMSLLWIHIFLDENVQFRIIIGLVVILSGIFIGRIAISPMGKSPRL